MESVSSFSPSLYVATFGIVKHLSLPDSQKRRLIWIDPGKYTYQDDVTVEKMAHVCMENYDPVCSELNLPIPYRSSITRHVSGLEGSCDSPKAVSLTTRVYVSKKRC